MNGEKVDEIEYKSGVRYADITPEEREAVARIKSAVHLLSRRERNGSPTDLIEDLSVAIVAELRMASSRVTGHDNRPWIPSEDIRRESVYVAALGDARVSATRAADMIARAFIRVERDVVHLLTTAPVSIQVTVDTHLCPVDAVSVGLSCAESVEEPCTETGGRCLWENDDEVHSAFCSRCRRWRDWKRAELGDP